MRFHPLILCLQRATTGMPPPPWESTSRAGQPWPPHHATFLSLLQCREVFSWGINDFGMLGNGGTSYATEPERVEGLEGVTIADVAAGGWHSMAISTEGGESRRVEG